MSLRDLVLPAIYETSSFNLIEDFFNPALGRSVAYDRGVGYFSSGWLRAAAGGMCAFAERGGHARWIASPVLSRKDWEALRLGAAAQTDETVRAALEKNLEDLLRTLEQDTLSALAWMIADRVLDFRLALPRDKLDQGEFHDKFGVFTDEEGNQISFNGSYNDSLQGLRNYESIKVFPGWDPAFAALVRSDARRFECLWNNRDDNVRTFDIPAAIKDRIVRYRASRRPYVKRSEDTVLGGLALPQPGLPPGLLLRDYQEKAIAAWFGNSCRGILEMATGTGKTVTGLAAATRAIEGQEKAVVVIVCPYKHLVDQWTQEAFKFGLRPVRVMGQRASWEGELWSQTRALNRGHRALVAAVTTYSSFCSGVFQEIMEPVWSLAVGIFDESHHAGAPKTREALPESLERRLALSATPSIERDEFGTDTPEDYFGPVIFSFGLREAIGKFLTPYVYHPVPVELNDEEYEDYKYLTHKLQRLASMRNDQEVSEAIKQLAIKRARVLNGCQAKLSWLSDNLGSSGRVHHTLVYTTGSRIDEVKRIVGIEKRIRTHEFTHRQPSDERRAILERFASGDIQALVAIECLDEGVDVPPARTAYFLASSSSSREFVQRRGRVLRKFPGKTLSTLYDLVAVPPSALQVSHNDADFSIVRSALARELRRVNEFADLAENRFQALGEVFDLARRFDLLDIGGHHD